VTASNERGTAPHAGPPRVAAQLLVRGIVQMVGYRAWTVRTAQALGLHGFVRNLHDARVEIFAEGDPAKIDALALQCRTGPRSARVDEVVRTDRAPRGANEFVWLADAAAPDDH
jgi:acylphosphatase